MQNIKKIQKTVLFFSLITTQVALAQTPKAVPAAPTEAYSKLPSPAEQFTAIDKDFDAIIKSGFKKEGKEDPLPQVIIGYRESLCAQDRKACLVLGWAKSSCAVPYGEFNKTGRPLILWESIFRSLLNEKEATDVWGQIQSCSPQVTPAQLYIASLLVNRSTAAGWSGLKAQISNWTNQNSSRAPSTPAQMTESMTVVSEIITQGRLITPVDLDFLAILARNSATWAQAQNIKSLPIASVKAWSIPVIQTISAVGELTKIPPFVELLTSVFGKEILKNEETYLREYCAAKSALNKFEECSNFMKKFYPNDQSLFVQMQEISGLANTGRFEKLEQRLATIKASLPGSAQAWRIPYVDFQLGLINQHQGKSAEAQKFLNSYLKQAPEGPKGDVIYAVENSFYSTYLQVQIYRSQKNFLEASKILLNQRQTVSRKISGKYWGYVFIDFEDLLLALHSKDRARVERSMKVFKLSLNNDDWEEFYRLVATAVGQKLNRQDTAETLQRLEKTRGKSYPPYKYFVTAMEQAGPL